MKVHPLKTMRVVISLIVLIVTSLLFLDIHRIIPQEWFHTILWLQFVPSLLKFSYLLGFTALGFAVVLLLTLLFGRIYCSTVCPLGIMQDVVARVGRKFRSKKGRRYHYSPPHRIWWYGILAVTVAALVAGSTWMLLLIDPYSNYGRILTYFLKPLVMAINNGLAAFLAGRDIYLLYPVTVPTVKAAVYAIPSIILLLTLWMSARHGRLYCNTVCPVGALLGLVSRVSLFRFTLRESACTMCRKCEFDCKSSCIDIEKKSIDASRCVTCFNCLDACGFGAVAWSVRPLFSGKKEEPQLQPVTPAGDQGPDLSKRAFLAGTLAFFAGMGGVARAKEYPHNAKPTTIPEEKEFPVTPPGSISIRHFTDHCTACSLCIDACPSDVLQPAFLQYGLAGLMQPTMDYRTGYCNYDCVRCTEVCPTGAILPLKPDAKKTVQMGTAVFIKESCVVYTDETNCGACAEHCPTKAVHMVSYKDDLVIPETTDDLCIGCGACEHACPTEPYKAIYVNGKAVHGVARKPKSEKIENPLDNTEDFPF